MASTPNVELHIEQSPPEGFFVSFDNNKIDIKEWLNYLCEIATEVLGGSYELSVNLISADEIKNLNKAWRKKNTPTDTLSFSYDKSNGEIFLCPEYIAINHQVYERTLGNFVWFIIIHSMHHLLGYEHGVDMEHAEKIIRSKFGI